MMPVIPGQLQYLPCQQFHLRIERVGQGFPPLQLLPWLDDGGSLQLVLLSVRGTHPREAEGRQTTQHS
jgi:hypothetical protein